MPESASDKAILVALKMVDKLESSKDFDAWLFRFTTVIKSHAALKLFNIKLDAASPNVSNPLDQDRQTDWHRVALIKTPQLDDLIPPPERGGAPALAKLLEARLRASSWVALSLGKDLTYLIKNLPSDPAVQMAAICNHFRPVDSKSCQDLHTQLQELSLDDFDGDFKRLNAEIKTIGNRLTCLGEQVTDQFMTSTLLNKLPNNDTFKIIKTVVEANNLGYERAAQDIYLHLRRNNLANTDDSVKNKTGKKSIEAAMSLQDIEQLSYLRDKLSPHGQRNFDSAMPKKTRDRILKKAAFNKKKRFISKRKRPPRRKFKGKCNICQKVGHKMQDCFFNPQSASYKGRPWNQTAPKRQKKDTPQMLASVISLASDIKTITGRLVPPQRPQPHLLTASAVTPPDFDALMTIGSSTLQKGKVIVDSGATSHYFNDSKRFSHLWSIPTRKVMVGNGQCISVKCAGIVPLILRTSDGASHPTSITALLVPEVPANFLSTAQLDSNDCSLVQAKGRMTISKGTKEVAFAKKHNSTWYLQCSWPKIKMTKISLRPHRIATSTSHALSTTDAAPAAFSIKRPARAGNATAMHAPAASGSAAAYAAAASAADSDAAHAAAAPAAAPAAFTIKRPARTMSDTPMHASVAPTTTTFSIKKPVRVNTSFSPYSLHQALGHQSLSKLRKTISATYGISLSKTLPRRLDCVACDLTKTKRASIMKKIPASISRANPNRVHADVKTMPKSVRGFKYWVALLHEGSRRVEAHLCKTKDEATTYTQRFIAKLLRDPKHAKNLEVRADGGGEFIAHSLQEWLKKNSVPFNPSPPRTPEMNSYAERIIGTLSSMVRAMLKQAKLSEGYWCFAVQVAAFLYNRTPHRALQSTARPTPHETFTNQRPDLSTIVPFGCIGVMHLAKATRTGMLADTGEYVRMLGYDARQQVYLVRTQEGAIKRTKITKWYKQLYRFPLVWRKAGPQGAAAGTGGTPRMAPRIEEEPTRQQNESPVQTPQQSLRRSNRTKRRPLREGVIPWEALASMDTNTDSLLVTVDEIESIPSNLHEAWYGKDQSHWRPSIKDELNSLQENKTWHAVNIDPHTKTIDTKWVFKKKLKADGSIRHKTRLVCRGYNQEYGVNYFNSYAPTLSLGSLRTLLAIAARHGYSIQNYDISCAYTYGKIDADIYLDIPEGYIPKDEQEAAFLKTPGRKALKLDRSLYGLVQSGHIWNATLKEFLLKQGFKPLGSDNCIFKKTVNGRNIIMGVYVDDLIILHKSHQDLADFTKALADRFKFKNLGPIRKTLGIEVDHNHDGSYSIHQQTYIAQLAEKFGQRCSKRAKTPLAIKKFDDYDDTDPKINNTLYRSVIGASLYVAVATRPDIMFAVNHLACFSQDPRQSHMDAALRLIRYLINTSHYRITYKTGDLVTYADASWNATKEGASVTGYFAEFAGGPVAWRSSRQKNKAMSSGEAEYVALSELGREIIHLRNLLSELEIPFAETTYAHCDSACAISMATKQGFTQRSKGIRLCYHNVREMVNNEEMHVEKIDGKINPADCLTKPLGRAKVEEYANVFFRTTKAQKRVRFRTSPTQTSSPKRAKSG